MNRKGPRIAGAFFVGRGASGQAPTYVGRGLPRQSNTQTKHKCQWRPVGWHRSRRCRAIYVSHPCRNIAMRVTLASANSRLVAGAHQTHASLIFNSDQVARFQGEGGAPGDLMTIQVGGRGLHALVVVVLNAKDLRRLRTCLFLAGNFRGGEFAKYVHCRGSTKLSS